MLQYLKFIVQCVLQWRFQHTWNSPRLKATNPSNFGPYCVGVDVFFSKMLALPMFVANKE